MTSVRRNTNRREGRIWGRREKKLPWKSLEGVRSENVSSVLPFHLQRGVRACSLSCPGIDPETQARCKLSATDRPIVRGDQCVLPRGKFTRWWQSPEGPGGKERGK